MMDSLDIFASVINLAKIDRSPFLKLRKRLAGCVPKPRDSSESDLEDSVLYRVYGYGKPGSGLSANKPNSCLLE